MRKDIRDLSLEKIYNDYRQLKAIEKKYYYCGNSIVFNKAAEGLMTLLKEEITRRKLEELETNHNLGPLWKKLEELSEFKNVTTTITTEDIKDYKPYTSTYTKNDSVPNHTY